MHHQQPLLFEQGMSITINQPNDSLYYYFDWDERAFSANMEFQHFHEFYEILILLENAASHLIEGEYYDLQKYDMVLLKPSLLHKSRYNPGPPSKRLIINFSIPIELPGLRRNMEGILAPFREHIPIFRFPQTVINELFASLNEIFSIASPKQPNNGVFIHAKFLQFLFTLNAHKEENSYERQQVADSITQKIYSITAYIHTHFKEPLLLSQLAEQFFISSCYLSHVFKEITGFTLTNYIQMTRIKNAQQLLLYTDLRIKEITERCGFTSFSQFNRVFNKFCGCPPSRYRHTRGSGGAESSLM
ncbi:MAG TPA: AraC family transcriptional regulator [Sphaerochaeta sp.]|nr:AraC family transcriptional regulator [Sphaerochaeta sp.]